VERTQRCAKRPRRLRARLAARALLRFSPLTDMQENAYRGKVAIITGGASGIGAALAKELARAGAEVVLADRQLDLADRVAGDIKSSGGRATAAEMDVRSFPSVARVVDDTVARLGGVGGEMDSYEPRDWDEVIDVNLRGVANGIQAVYPVMIRQRGGHIVNTASVAGLLTTPSQGSYTATKHAVVALSRALRIEAKRHGVNVSVLCPGVIRTPILGGGKYGRLNVTGLTDQTIRAMWDRLRPIEPEVLARKAAQAVARNEAIIVIPAWWKAVWLFERISPALSAALSQKVLEITRKEMEAAGARPRVPILDRRATIARREETKSN
jgi:NAD(P)-dependent dehydrogenase (short-subunit alcohol dehydrogenase family)